VELLVIPELGAAIVSLRSVRTGRQWMWQRPDAVGLFPNALGDPFEQSPLTGAVECLPTIAPCAVPGRMLPDHGEAWMSAWELDEAAFRCGAIQTSVRLPISQLEFSRSIQLDGPVARFAYRIVNPSPQPVSYLWAFHPLFAVGTGDRLELPASIQSVRAAASQGYPCLAETGEWKWPEPVPGFRLDAVGDGSRPDSFAKVFADYSECREGYAALCRGDERLEFRFDPKEVSGLGLWFTDGGWQGFTHVAIEPTSHTSDSLLDAGGKLLTPGSESRWQFEISFRPCNSNSAKEPSCDPRRFAQS
jgi:galactose mutarotase-like enzyme